MLPEDLEGARVVVEVHMTLVPEAAASYPVSGRDKTEPLRRGVIRRLMSESAEQGDDVALEVGAKAPGTGSIVHGEDHDAHGPEVLAHPLLDGRVLRSDDTRGAIKPSGGLGPRRANPPTGSLEAGLLLESLADDEAKDAPSVVAEPGAGSAVSRQATPEACACADRHGVGANPHDARSLSGGGTVLTVFKEEVEASLRPRELAVTRRESESSSLTCAQLLE
jgi:hypothetical protein